MNIILEGPDNSGKSTLAEHLGTFMGLEVVKSEGREKWPGEVNDRIRRYNSQYNKVIYDRHPVVSQTLYNLIKTNTPVDEELLQQFYQEKNILVYCRPLIERKMEGHVAKDYDEPEYLATIEEKYGPLVKLYDEWALSHAHFLYRIGDDRTRLLEALKGAYSHAKSF